MSLNELAMDMWEKLGYESVDASVLSRVINGKRLFTVRQLRVFCKILKLNKGESTNLEYLLYADLNRKFGFGEDFFVGSSKHIIEFASDNLNKIREVRFRDIPIIAEEWAENTTDRIKSEFSVINGTERKELLKILGQILVERMHCLRDTSLPNESKRKFVYISKELRGIGIELGDENFIQSALFNVGSFYYFLTDCSKAINPLEMAIGMNTNPNETALTLRLLALSYAYKKDLSGFRKTKLKLIDDLPSCQDEIKCSVIEGLARGEALLGDFKAAKEALSSGWSLISKIDDANGMSRIHRRIQLIRTELEIAGIFKERNFTYLEGIGSQGIDLIKHYGYFRYKPLIEKSLQRIYL